MSYIIYDNYGRIMAIRVKKRYDARQYVAGAWGLRLEAFFHYSWSQIHTLHSHIEICYWPLIIWIRDQL